MRNTTSEVITIEVARGLIGRTIRFGEKGLRPGRYSTGTVIGVTERPDLPEGQFQIDLDNNSCVWADHIQEWIIVR